MRNIKVINWDTRKTSLVNERKGGQIGGAMSVWMTYVNRRKSSTARIQLKYPSVGGENKRDSESGFLLGACQFNENNEEIFKCHPLVLSHLISLTTLHLFRHISPLTDSQ